MDDMSIGTKNLSLNNQITRARTVTPKRTQRTSPPADIEVRRRSSLPEAVYPSIPSPSAPTGNVNLGVMEEVATVKLVQSLASAPSPLVPTLPVYQPPTNHPPQRQPFETTPPSQYPPAPGSGYQRSHPPPAGYPPPASYHPRAYTQPGRLVGMVYLNGSVRNLVILVQASSFLSVLSQVATHHRMANQGGFPMQPHLLTWAMIPALGSVSVEEGAHTLNPHHNTPHLR